MAKGLIWFRADLRLDDNPAVNAALSECEEGPCNLYFFSFPVGNS
jgi:deoxyribodipyrimidine photolyase